MKTSNSILKRIYVFLNFVPIVIIFLLFFLSCDKKNKEIVSVVDYFNKEKQLTHKDIKIQDESNHFLDPKEIVVQDNMMIVAQGRVSKFFSLIDLDTEKWVKDWGEKGQGPEDMIGFLDFYQNYNQSGINVWDPQLKRLFFYSFDNIRNQSKPSPLNLFQNLNNQVMLAMLYPNILQLNELQFLALGNMEDKRFSILDIASGQMIKTGDYPVSDRNTQLHPIFRNKPYNGKIRLNEEKQKVAYISYESEMFEIFQITDSGLVLAYGNYTTIPKYEQSGKGDITIERFGNGKGSYVSMTSSKDYIYILYRVYPENADSKNIDQLSSLDSNTILVFDWDGKPIVKYNLDCMVNLIYFDKQKNRLYSIQGQEENIIYFEL